MWYEESTPWAILFLQNPKQGSIVLCVKNPSSPENAMWYRYNFN